MPNPHQATNTSTITADIAIIGGGGSGLAAAVTAAQNGANVLVLESRRAVGGNSVFASGFFTPGSPRQSPEELLERTNEYFRKAMVFNHWKTNPGLTRALIHKSGSAIDWLEELGVKFDADDKLHPDRFPPVYRVSGRGKGGANIVRALQQACQQLGVSVICQTRAVRLLTQDGKITGVLAEADGQEIKVSAGGVIIATGGFAGNRELLKQYFPYYKDDVELVLRGLPHQGDGLLMAREAGADSDGYALLEMSMFLFHDSYHMSIIAKRSDMVWLNKKGERFTDESVAFADITNTLLRQPGQVCYAVFDEQHKQAFFRETLPPMDANLIADGSWPAQAEKELHTYAGKGLVRISESWDDMAEWMGADPAVLKASIEAYNTACDRGRDDAFVKDKRYLVPVRTPPFYAIRCCSNLLVTHGDIKVNECMEVMDKKGDPIPGLYAAGDDTGDIDHDTYNIVMPGHSLGFAINSGRIAGENAAGYAAGAVV